MDILLPITMKSAAKCDKQCELQNSANHQIFERKWRQRDILLACLFQCLRGFTLTLMWLNRVSKFYLLPLFSHERCARGSFGPMKWSHHSNVISLEAPNYHLLTRGIILLLNAVCMQFILLYTTFILSTPCIWDRQDHPLNLSIIIKRRKRNQHRLPQ